MTNRTDYSDGVRLALEILRRIPRKRRVTAAQIQIQLEGSGITRSLRSVQRILDQLSANFPIERDDRSRPYGYRWSESAPQLTVPSLSTTEALLIQLVSEHLRGFLPVPLLSSLETLFEESERNFAASPNQLGAHWSEKVAFVPETQPLLPPKIDPIVFDEVSEGLFHDRWIEVTYINADGKITSHDVMPLGLAQQGVRVYLVCRFKGYGDERSLSLHRIKKCTVTDVGFNRPPSFSLKKYRDSGSFSISEHHDVLLRFCIGKKEGAHLLETPLSVDQSMIDHGCRNLPHANSICFMPDHLVGSHTFRLCRIYLRQKRGHSRGFGLGCGRSCHCK